MSGEPVEFRTYIVHPVSVQGSDIYRYCDGSLEHPFGESVNDWYIQHVRSQPRISRN